MVATKRYELFTDGTSTVRLPLALLGVADHPLHLVAGRQAAVGVPALAGVHQRLDAPLDGQLPSLLRVGGRVGGVAATSVQVEPELLHLVGMAVLLVASDAQVEVVTDRAVVPGLDRLDTSVAVVDKLVLALERDKHY